MPGMVLVVGVWMPVVRLWGCHGAKNEIFCGNDELSEEKVR
jgi:hypothetical protein